MQNRLLKRVKNAIIRRVMPCPVAVRHAEYSMFLSEDDAAARPNARLMELSLKAFEFAAGHRVDDVQARLNGRFPYPDEAINVWPGEHYRLLAALVEVIRPRLVIEVGTAEGISALSMLEHLPPGARIVSFDIVPWREYPCTCLEDGDFRDGRLEQVVADLGRREDFDRYRELLGDADLFFVDASKDGHLERRLIRNFETVAFRSAPVFVFDDIRVWNMLAIWRELRWPKLDLTSFGHWSGTGLCEPVVAAAANDRQPGHVLPGVAPSV